MAQASDDQGDKGDREGRPYNTRGLPLAYEYCIVRATLAVALEI